MHRPASFGSEKDMPLWISDRLILSGFQAPGEGAVLAALGGANLRRLDRRAEGGWITFLL
ncbi:MAG: hypothetical protein HY766_06825, partial [candidate division NC10 bacterium]|nr:hypothetical protein [candidate division NC10 bacterium]